jgi:hypothetical protein
MATEDLQGTGNTRVNLPPGFSSATQAPNSGATSVPGSGGQSVVDRDLAKAKSDTLKEIDERVLQMIAYQGEKTDVQLRLGEYDRARANNESKFWDKFVAEPVNQAITEFAAEFGADDEAISSAATRTKAELSSLLSIESTWKNFDAKYGKLASSEDFSNLEKLFSNPETEKYIIEQYISPYARSALDKDTCENTVVGAAIGTITKTAVGAVRNQVQAVYALNTSLALLINQVDGLGSAFLQMPVQNLISILASRDLIIDRIIKVSEAIASISNDMSDRDYPFDHPYWLREEQRRLKLAEDKLSRIQAVLEGGGEFNTALWVSAKKDIDETADALCGANIDQLLSGLSLRPIALAGLSAYLKSLVSVLQRQQQIRNLLINSIVSFNSRFFELTRFDNLFVPIVQTIRCRLTKINDQIDAAIKKNQFFYYLVKEKEWCLYLKAISALMSASIKFNLPENINKFTGTQILKDAADSVVSTLNQATIDSIDASALGLIRLCNEMILVARRKATYNISPNYLTNLAASIRAEGLRLKGIDDPVSKILDFFSGLVPTQAFEAVLIVNQLMSFAKDRNLDQFVDAIQAGNLEDAFGITGLIATIDQTVTFGISNYIAGSIAGGGLFGEPLREAIAVRDASLRRARSQAAKQRIRDYADEGISEAFDKVKELKETRRSMNRVLEGEDVGTLDTNYLA